MIAYYRRILDSVLQKDAVARGGKNAGTVAEQERFDVSRHGSAMESSKLNQKDDACACFLFCNDHGKDWQKEECRGGQSPALMKGEKDNVCLTERTLHQQIQGWVVQVTFVHCFWSMAVKVTLMRPRKAANWLARSFHPVPWRLLRAQELSEAVG